jgi:hypothetical protein
MEGRGPYSKAVVLQGLHEGCLDLLVLGRDQSGPAQSPTSYEAPGPYPKKQRDCAGSQVGPLCGLRSLLPAIRDGFRSPT